MWMRALFGESPSEESADEIIELRCNIDDMTGEEIGFAFDKLLNAGAADVYTVPTGMKKNRPGIMLCVLCNAEKRSELQQYLTDHQILSTVYWPMGPLVHPLPESSVQYIYDHIISLPCDQRFSPSDMQYVAQILMDYSENFTR